MIYKHLKDISMKKYRIRVLIQSGSTSYFGVDKTISAELVYSGGNGYYKFMDDKGKDQYYPIINTIIEEL